MKKDMALFIKKFKKYIKKKFSKGDNKFKSITKRTCYNCGKHNHFIDNCSFEHRDDDDDKKKSSPTRRTRAIGEVTSPTRRSPMVKLTSGKNGRPMMRALILIVTVWQLWLSRESLRQASISSQSTIKGNTLALWQRKTSVW
jgi:hypothetical protein